jgi:hypothetical protein
MPGEHTPEEKPPVEGTEADLPSAALLPAELTEYQTLIGILMSRVDWMIKRMRLLDIEGRAILDGARDESDLTKSIFASPESGSAVQLVPNRCELSGS